MRQLTCEMCGGNDLVKQDGVFICQTCGTKYSVEEAKKMMVEGTVDVTGTVTIDSSVELRNLYELARRAKNDNNSANAQMYYSQIIVKDPSSWEANFYTTYYQSLNCTIGEIGLAANRVKNCEETVFNLIKNNVNSPIDQQRAVNEVAGKLISISTIHFMAYMSHYHKISPQIQDGYVMEYFNNCTAAIDILYKAGDLIVNIFGDNYGKIATGCWEIAIKQHDGLNRDFRDKKIYEKINEYSLKIKKFNPSYIPPNTSQSGACCVATAVYGSYDCPQVWTLRRYRDFNLAKTWYGRVFVRMYYAISPYLVKWFGHTVWFKKLWKGKLDRMVRDLQEKGYESTPYIDREWKKNRKVER